MHLGSHFTRFLQAINDAVKQININKQAFWDGSGYGQFGECFVKIGVFHVFPCSHRKICSPPKAKINLSRPHLQLPTSPNSGPTLGHGHQSRAAEFLRRLCLQIIGCSQDLRQSKLLKREGIGWFEPLTRACDFKNN
jgi:hypothetical protein